MTAKGDSYASFAERQHGELEYLGARREQLKRRARLAANLDTKEKLIKFIRKNEDIFLEIISEKSLSWIRSKDFTEKIRNALLDKIAPLP